MSEDLTTYVQLCGPGIDALENRKDAGSKVEITEREMFDSYERVKHRLFAGIKQLLRT